MDVGLIDLPPEILYLVARHMNLLDYGRVLLSCKQAAESLGMDLQLQKIVCDNTPLSAMHSKKNLPIRMVYQNHIFLTALKLNNVDILNFAKSQIEFPDLTVRSYDLPGRIYIQVSALFTTIYLFDADDVLNHVAEVWCHQFQQKNNGVNPHVALSSILGKMLFSFSLDEAAYLARSTRFVLSLFKKYEADILYSLTNDSDKNEYYGIKYWELSNSESVEFLGNLLEFQKLFPEYSFDFNIVMMAESTPMTPLELAAHSGNRTMFDLLLKNGAIFDPKLPYLAIVLRKSVENWAKLGFSQNWIYQLIELGADINVPLPKFVDHFEREILLYFISSTSATIEILLSLGAKLRLDIETLPPMLQGHCDACYALKAHMIDYKPLKPMPLKFSCEGFGGYRKFVQWPTTLRFKPDGEFILREDISRNKREYIGPWKIDNDGKIICKVTHRMVGISIERGGHYEEVLAPMFHTFILFKMFRDKFVITEEIVGKSTIEMICNCMTEYK